MLRFDLIAKILSLCVILSLGCGYHRLDRRPNVPTWFKKGEVVSIMDENGKQYAKARN